MDEYEICDTSLTVKPGEPFLSLDPKLKLTQDQAHISLYASSSGHLALETLRLLGCISTHNVEILIDGECTQIYPRKFG